MRLIKLICLGSAIISMAACSSNRAPSNSANEDTAQKVPGFVMNNAVFFNFNTADIAPSYQKLITLNASYLISHPGAKVQIQGNSSEVGSAEHNQQLSLQRAQSVKQALLKSGVSAKQIALVAYGNTKPAFATLANGQQPKNQRADIIYTALPPFQYSLNKVPQIDSSTMY